MGQKNSILHAIDRETIKVQTNVHRQNTLPGQDLMQKIAQIFFEDSCEPHILSFIKIIGES